MKNSQRLLMVLFTVIVSSSSMIASIVPFEIGVPVNTSEELISSVDHVDRTIELTTLEQEKIRLRDEISFYLRDMNLEEREISADVNFKVNDRKRIEVMDIDCTDDELCQKIKRRLSNRKVGTKLTNAEETYRVKFIFLLQ